ncbi:MAG: dockerin type I domain-containing protein, partial [Isosphaeraceae bacterium]
GTSTISATYDGIMGSTVLTASPAVAITVTSAAVSWGTSGNSGPLVTQSDGLRLLPVGRNTDMPWLGINRITITLSSAPASLVPADVKVTGITVANYGPVTISGGGTTYTITLATPINLPDRVTVTIGNAGIATYTRRLDVLPGDVNDDGYVNSTDAVLVRAAALGQTVSILGIFLDVNGDGAVNMTDFSLVSARSGQRLP